MDRGSYTKRGSLLGTSCSELVQKEIWTMPLALPNRRYELVRHLLPLQDMLQTMSPGAAPEKRFYNKGAAITSESWPGARRAIPETRLQALQ